MYVSCLLFILLAGASAACKAERATIFPQPVPRITPCTDGGLNYHQVGPCDGGGDSLGRYAACIVMHSA
jgi:hypothetical protein